MRSMSKERLQYIQSLMNTHPAMVNGYNLLAIKALRLAIRLFDVNAWEEECRRYRISTGTKQYKKHSKEA